MKDEKDFLNSMWTKISKTEREMEEMSLSNKLNRKFILRDLFFYIVIVSISFVILNLKIIKDMIYLVAPIMLIAAFIIENKNYLSPKGEN